MVNVNMVDFTMVDVYLVSLTIVENTIVYVTTVKVTMVEVIMVDVTMVEVTEGPKVWLKAHQLEIWPRMDFYFIISYKLSAVITKSRLCQNQTGAFLCPPSLKCPHLLGSGKLLTLSFLFSCKHRDGRDFFTAADKEAAAVFQDGRSYSDAHSNHHNLCALKPPKDKPWLSPVL